jgi:hypothetical protein
MFDALQQGMSEKIKYIKVGQLCKFNETRSAYSILVYNTPRHRPAGQASQVLKSVNKEYGVELKQNS